MARIFLAIEVSDEVREELARIGGLLDRRLGESVRLTRPEQLHLTLIFLGEIEGNQIDEVAACVESGARAEPFELRLATLGFFPESGPPAVVWVGLEDPARALEKLVAAVSLLLRGAGFSLEDRRFVPHLTVARLKDPPPRTRLLGSEIVVEPLPLTVQTLTLFRSERGPRGAEHVTVKRFRLGAGGSR